MSTAKADSIGALILATQRLPAPAAAAAWAQAGHPVFPCVPGGKAPLTAHGFRDATTELRRVAQWWRRWPEANIGLPTGDAVDVVDVDERRTGSGFTALTEARRAGLLGGWVAAVRTPHQGLHLYYPAQGDAASWSLAAAHVDFRGAGGYILIPPSVVADDTGVRRYLLGAYRRSGHPVDSVRLRAFLHPPTLFPARPGRPVPGAGHIERITAWLAGQSEGNRNQALFWAGCRLAEHGVALSDALGALTPAATAAGLSGREINRTLRSAYRTATPRLPTITTPLDAPGRDGGTSR
ncbi:MAG TPA: bifunctional DNA primase/polymerase [Lacisediminihabitans sp.]|uniref:bifunctional DNA primase/polymerase n=1 Tax=Lacisediminihabitans sp. TaxID=2787631 RepID=UPI002ED90418